MISGMNSPIKVFRDLRRKWRMRDCPHPMHRLWCLHDEVDGTWCMDCDTEVPFELEYCTHTGESHEEMREWY